MLIRLSGTEPLIRILVEGNDLNKVNTIANIEKTFGKNLENNKINSRGFKDHIDFNTNVEHEYKNKTIDIFVNNGF